MLRDIRRLALPGWLSVMAMPARFSDSPRMIHSGLLYCFCISAEMILPLYHCRQDFPLKGHMMKTKFVSGGAGLLLLATVGVAADAHAQRSPWWERQKAAQTATVAGEPAAPGEAAQPPTQPYQPHASAIRREKVEGPSYTYVEGGAARLEVDVKFAVDGDVLHLDESANGGYLRGSVAVTDHLYVFGGHDRVSESWKADAERLKVTIDQTEIGLGNRIPLSSRTDFISELSMLRLGAKVSYRDLDYPEDDFSGSDHLYAGKLMLGFRGRPVPNFEWWAKAGYLRVEDDALIDHSVVGNVGLQYRFTPVWGLVGEAEFYEDVRFYRLGVRASF